MWFFVSSVKNYKMYSIWFEAKMYIWTISEKAEIRTADQLALLYSKYEDTEVAFLYLDF